MMQSKILSFRQLVETNESGRSVFVYGGLELEPILQEDPTLERHFKGHRDTVTSVCFNPNMKQLGETNILHVGTRPNLSSGLSTND